MRALEDIIQLYLPEVQDALRSPMAFYVGVAGLLTLGAVLIAKTPKYSCAGGDEYERRRLLRFVGGLSMAFAVGWFGVREFYQNVYVCSIDLDAVPASSLVVTVPAEPALKPLHKNFHFVGDIPAASDQSAVSTASVAPDATPADQPAQPAYSSPYMPTPSNVSAAVSRPEVKVSEGAVTADQIPQLLRDTAQLLEQKKFDAALQTVNQVFQVSPQNATAYMLRGNIYGQKKQWDLAELDYRKSLQWDSKNVGAKFNLAEIRFMQKKYDMAKPGFLALEQDPNMGDLATYKAFLCDLFGGHQDAASAELNTFDQIGSNASYYFANVAWSLVHQKTEDARTWLTTAANIYSPTKVTLYATSLHDLGYLPLPAPNNRLTSNQ